MTSADLLLILMACSAHGAITKSPSSLSACVGTNVTLAWDYDNESLLKTAVWYKDEKLIGTLHRSSPTGFSHKVKYVDGGTIELLNINENDTDTYKFAVLYDISSRLPTSESTVTITVKAPPVVPSVKTGTDEMTCSTPNLGSPPVKVQIKVGNKLKPSESAPVPKEQTVGCCVTGESVTCLKENADRSMMYCQEMCKDAIAVETDEAPNVVGDDAPSADFRSCYICSGCKDTFSAADVPTMKCSGSCRKERFDDCHVVRSCACRRMSPGCSKKGNILTCYCDGETCNGSACLKATMALTIMSALLSWFRRVL